MQTVKIGTKILNVESMYLRKIQIESKKNGKQKKDHQIDMKNRMKSRRKRYKNQRTKFLNDWKSENESKRLQSRACNQEFAKQQTFEHEKFLSESYEKSIAPR